MNVRECYEAINGDYEEVKRRFLTDARIRRFALLFQAAHTLKGVCLNLGFTGLYRPVSSITELLRAGEYENALEEMEQVEKDYTTAERSLRELEES